MDTRVTVVGTVVSAERREYEGKVSHDITVIGTKEMGGRDFNTVLNSAKIRVPLELASPEVGQNVQIEATISVWNGRVSLRAQTYTVGLF